MQRGIPKIALFALALMPMISGAQDRFALVIGNGNYINVEPLPNPTNDVELISSALKDVGFHVTLLKDADRRTMDRAAKKFADQLHEAGPNTVGVFYYAGHGVSYEGENWLLPVGVEITHSADIEYETISANKILNLMEGARNATDILILDACRNSPFRSFSLTGTRAVSRGMSEMNAPRGSYIAYSTAPGAVAYDGDGQYSPFAEALASEVGTPGITIDVMMINVRNKVEEKTARLGQEPQTPWSASSMRDPFAFNPVQQQVGSTLPDPDPSPPRNPSQRQQSGQSADSRLWASIENSNDPAEFDVYLKRYPDGQYAELARIRKNRLSKENSPQPTPKDVIPLEPDLYGGIPDYDKLPPNVYATPDGMIPKQEGMSHIWYDDKFNQWQVLWIDANFSASAYLPDAGQLVYRGEREGLDVSYGIFDSVGTKIGYGEGRIDGAGHIKVTSYRPDGAVIDSGQFHINHQPEDEE